jgi:hypothetical protein
VFDLGALVFLIFNSSANRVFEYVSYNLLT